MHQALLEWEEYCGGDTNYDRSNFMGLLCQKWTDDELNHIFRRVPLRDAVIHNLRKVYENSEDDRHVYLRPKPDNAANPDELMSLVKNFIDSQRRFLLERDIAEETRIWLERAEIEISLVSPDELKAVGPNDDMSLYIRQEEAEYREFRPEARMEITNADSVAYRVVSGIREALYGLSADDYLACFVLMPLLNADVDYGTYFEFWRKGGDYVLTDSQIQVASIWGKRKD